MRHHEALRRARAEFGPNADVRGSITRLVVLRGQGVERDELLGSGMTYEDALADAVHHRDLGRSPAGGEAR